MDSSQLLSLSLPSRKRNSSAIPYSFLAHMVHYTRKLWSGVVQARLVYTHLLCHTASLSRAWQVSRRHVLHFRWDLCFIRIGYHQAPVLKQSHLSKLKMNLTKKITLFKTWNIILQLYMLQLKSHWCKWYVLVTFFNFLLPLITWPFENCAKFKSSQKYLTWKKKGKDKLITQ